MIQQHHEFTHRHNGHTETSAAAISLQD